MSKQDRQGVRAASELERKYNFNKTFAEMLGLAEEATEAAEKANDSVGKLDKKMNQEELFNRLTNNGEAQGIFRDEDGNIYINAAYIVSISELFAKDITMSGKLTNTAEIYLSPGEEELEIIRNHIDRTSTLPSDRISLYDFNGDGTVNLADYILAKRYVAGTSSFSDWSGAIKSTVTITLDLTNADKVLRIYGTNMWGREIDIFISADAPRSTFATRDSLNALVRTDGEHLYRVVDGETEWINPPMVLGAEYKTIERWQGKPVYVTLIDFGALPASAAKQPICLPEGVTVVGFKGFAIKAASASSVDTVTAQFPVFSSGGSLLARANISGTTINVVTYSDVSSYNAYFTVKYVYND